MGYIEPLRGRKGYIKDIAGREGRCVQISEQPSTKKRSEMPGQSTSEQQRKIKSEAIPKWAQGIYYNEGNFREALVYHDDESLYFELRGKDSGIVRFSFEMLETLGRVIEEEQEEQEASPQ
jgi:hypothetical protein